MGLYASWTHGNAITVESPENLARVGYFGWGGDMLIRPGKSSWFHIPIPTPVITLEGRTKLQRVFLLFLTNQGFGTIRSVHVYDGASVVQKFDGLSLQGDHRGGLDGHNTFSMATPHTVAVGIGISFLCVAAIGFDSPIPPSAMTVASAGGDFTT